MCGIAGFFGIEDRGIIRKMISAIAYRGPDNIEVFCKENLCLGHARLSILDLKQEANQPFVDEEFIIVYNGEIYNFQNLKELYLKDISFKTNCDTEVIVKMFRKYGVAMLDKIHGMFAMAIYNQKTETLFMARDRTGKKPLYYTNTPKSFVFASELKALRYHPEVSSEVDLDALNSYLTYDYVPAPASILKDVKKFFPGHYMLVENGEIKHYESYWDMSYEKSTLSFEEARLQLDNLLDNATQRRLISDVPLGVFLSGGLDSSAVAFYAQKNSTSRIKTFSIGFEEKSYDESDYASKVSKYLGTDHTFDILTEATAKSLIEPISGLIDEPFADASIIPTYYLSKITRNQVTVALGGDGSDELFLGYPTFQAHHFKNFIPRIALSALRNLCDAILPVSDRDISFDFKIKQFLRGLTGTDKETHQLWLGSFLPGEKHTLLTDEVIGHLGNENGLSPIYYYFQKTENLNSLDRAGYYYCKTYLVDDILFKVDRASMYNSLEVRAPFLDTDVVEFANSLPWNFKQRRLSGKYILKKTMDGKIPHEVIYRPKKGFGLPLSRWLRSDLGEMVKEMFSETMMSHNFFNQNKISEMVKQHENSSYNHRKQLWNLFMFQLWYWKFFDC